MIGGATEEQQYGTAEFDKRQHFLDLVKLRCKLSTVCILQIVEDRELAVYHDVELANEMVEEPSLIHIVDIMSLLLDILMLCSIRHSRR